MTDPFVLTEVSQVRALVSVPRSQIMELLTQGEEKSVAELARLIDASGPATQYHVSQLVDAGLVKLAGKRRTGPRSESVYRAVSTTIRIQSRSESPEYMEALLALAMNTIRKLEKEIVAAHASPSFGDLDTQPVSIRSRRGTVQADDLPRLNALIGEALNLIQPGDRKDDQHRVALRIFLVRLIPEEVSR